MTRRALLFLITLFLAVPAAAQDTTSIDLRGLAAFRIGDDDVWRSKYIDEEQEWNFVTVPGAWEENGFPLTDGFAWYRIRFRIPRSMRDDSLLLVMSGVDDADETFLNGVLVGKTGAFPPQTRSEIRSLRVYPLPRFIREEFNLLAVRVFDAGDNGGITGEIFRIVRADSMHRVLDELIDAPGKEPPRFISNGVMTSAWQPDSALLIWSRPRLYDRISPDLPTEPVLSRLAMTVDNGNGARPFIPTTSGFIEQTGIIHARAGANEVFWYHPLSTKARILVVAVRQPVEEEAELGLQFVMDRPYWRYEERKVEDGGMRTTYHILAYNACCTELADRDMEEFLSAGENAFSLESDIAAWRAELAASQFLPDLLSADEQTIYRRALVTMLQMQVRENGLAQGQLVAALQPASKAVCLPADHLLAAEALAVSGLTSAAHRALDFIHGAQHDTYKLYDVYGREHGVGFPYLVSPARYDGSGNEWQWEDREQALLRYEGMPRYIMALDALRERARLRALTTGAAFSDSAFIAPFWPRLSAEAADVLMYRLDSLGLFAQDDSPWGQGLSDLPGVYTTILASHALRIAASHAALLRQDLKAFLYNEAAERSQNAILKLIEGVLARERADSLGAVEMRLFHPLLADGIALGVLDPDSEAGRFAIDVVESGFAIEDTVNLYRAEPGGDWFARQARPQIALRLARAYAVAGNMHRAEALFSAVTREALRHDGVLPELVDPVTGNWYGGLPSLATAADYVLTAEMIAMKRLESPRP
ncbi:MAG: hypothetical protein IH600_16285 [Bacteroidetes bacterium]|nr:hypothetical protein [Bacteroidota bacterium]